MTLTIRLPAVPIYLPPGTLEVAGEVFLKLPPHDLVALLTRLRDRNRPCDVLYDDDGHRVESHYSPGGYEVWVIVRNETRTALVVLPIEAKEVDS